MHSHGHRLAERVRHDDRQRTRATGEGDLFARYRADRPAYGKQARVGGVEIRLTL